MKTEDDKVLGGLSHADRELVVQLIIRYARGGNEHQLVKARTLLGLPWEWEPNHRCQFCSEPQDVPLSRHWGDVAVAKAEGQ